MLSPSAPVRRSPSVTNLFSPAHSGGGGGGTTISDMMAARRITPQSRTPASRVSPPQRRKAPPSGRKKPKDSESARRAEAARQAPPGSAEAMPPFPSAAWWSLDDASDPLVAQIQAIHADLRRRRMEELSVEDRRTVVDSKLLRLDATHDLIDGCNKHRGRQHPGFCCISDEHMPEFVRNVALGLEAGRVYCISQRYGNPSLKITDAASGRVRSGLRVHMIDLDFKNGGAQWDDEDLLNIASHIVKETMDYVRLEGDEVEEGRPEEKLCTAPDAADGNTLPSAAGVVYVSKCDKVSEKEDRYGRKVFGQGVHLNFSVVLDADQARALRCKLVPLLEERFPRERGEGDNSWADVYDARDKACRMNGCDKVAKCSDCGNIATYRPFCSTCQGRGRIFQNRPYRVEWVMDASGEVMQEATNAIALDLKRELLVTCPRYVRGMNPDAWLVPDAAFLLPITADTRVRNKRSRGGGGGVGGIIPAPSAATGAGALDPDLDDEDGEGGDRAAQEELLDPYERKSEFAFFEMMCRNMFEPYERDGLRIAKIVIQRSKSRNIESLVGYPVPHPDGGKWPCINNFGQPHSGKGIYFVLRRCLDPRGGVVADEDGVMKQRCFCQCDRRGWQGLCKDVESSGKLSQLPAHWRQRMFQGGYSKVAIQQLQATANDDILLGRSAARMGDRAILNSMLSDLTLQLWGETPEMMDAWSRRTAAPRSQTLILRQPIVTSASESRRQHDRALSDLKKVKEEFEEFKPSGRPSTRASAASATTARSASFSATCPSSATASRGRTRP